MCCMLVNFMCHHQLWPTSVSHPSHFSMIIPPAQRSYWGGILVSFHLSVCLSICTSHIPCLLCSTYSSGWIHFIFIHLIKRQNAGVLDVLVFFRPWWRKQLPQDIPTLSLDLSFPGFFPYTLCYPCYFSLLPSGSAVNTVCVSVSVQKIVKC